MGRLTSIIIPFYNEAPHLERTLDSALAQRGSPVEWILVDDGSTDGSTEIAQAKARDNPDIRLIRQENSGLGAARNRGMEQARGEYILFLDGDDELMEGAVETLVSRLEQSQAGMVACRFHLVGEGGQILSTGGFRLDSPWLRSEEAARALFDYRLTNTVWAKLYRREHIRDIRFPDRLWFEDLPFVLQALIRSESLALVENPLWKIKARPGSISRRRLELRRIRDSYEIFRINRDWAQSRGMGGQFLETLVHYQWDQFIDCLIFLAQDRPYLNRPGDLAKEIMRCLRDMESQGWTLHPFRARTKLRDRTILWTCLQGFWSLSLAMVRLGKASRYRAISRIRQLGTDASRSME